MLCLSVYKTEGKHLLTDENNHDTTKQEDGVSITCYVCILNRLGQLDSNIAIYMLQDYELDGIDWTKVDFEDNQVCLDLFEKVFIWFKISKILQLFLFR